MTSDLGMEEARTLTRFLWGDSRERTSWCDLEPLHCPGTETPEMQLPQSETHWKSRTH